MAKTYLATDNKGKKIVLKTLTFSQIKDWKVFDLFEREIKILENLNHDFIPDYYENFKQDIEGENIYVLVQEYVKGTNLYHLIESGKKMTLDKIKLLLIKLLKILDYIHNLNPAIIHRDINPKNIILSHTGELFLVDFGAVGNIINDTMAAGMSSTFVGTLGYMPPEQLFGKVTPASDIYSLGVTILFLLSGKEPSEFEFKNMKLDFSFIEHIDEDFRNLLESMIEPDMDKRLSNTKEILTILKGKKLLNKNKKSTQTEIKENRLGVSFRFMNGEEAYSVSEFKKILKEGLFNKTISTEIIDIHSKFFQAATAWFKNYHNLSYSLFFWNEMAPFIDENKDDIKEKKVLKKYANMRKLLHKFYEIENNKIQKEQKKLIIMNLQKEQKKSKKLSKTSKSKKTSLVNHQQTNLYP